MQERSSSVDTGRCLAPSPPAVATVRGAAEMIPIVHETAERVVRVVVVAVPPAALLLAGWLAWGGALHPHDLIVLAITYALIGLGVTVGYHRLFTHRSFKTARSLRALLAVLGSMAVEGPVIEWAAAHRGHHCFSDHPGDPHSLDITDPGSRRIGRGPPAARYLAVPPPIGSERPGGRAQPATGLVRLRVVLSA